MSGLKDRIQQDLKAAMLARDSFLSDTLGGIKAAILNQEIAESKRDEGLDDASIEKLIATEVKKRVEAAGLYEQGGNADSADKERREVAVLEKYLPTQMTDEALEAVISEVIQALGVGDPKDMGRVIGGVKSKVGNSADGGKIAQLVKSKLQ